MSKRSIILCILTLVLISPGLSCSKQQFNVECLKFSIYSVIKSLKIMHQKTKTVPVNTNVTLHCSFTSSCQAPHMITISQTNGETQLDIHVCNLSQSNGTLICHTTITEPVEVRCVGRQSKDCHLWGSISIEIGKD